MKFAFFDFDDTIAKGDSLFKLYPFCFKRYPLSLLELIPLLIYFLFYACHFISNDTMKEQLLVPLKYLEEDELKEFYNTCIIPTIYPHMIDEIIKRKNEGCLCIVITASSEAYMKYHHLPIDYLMGTKTQYHTNKLIGHNCKGQEKVARIHEYLVQNNYSIDYEHSYAYSDSDVDLPMLQLVKNRIRINKKDGSMSLFEN